MIWLLNRLQPDFKTIADFRRDNRQAFKQVFRQFNMLCRQLDLFGRELLAVDGTRSQGGQQSDRNHGTHQKFNGILAAAEERLTRYLKQLDEADERNKEEGLTDPSVEGLEQKIASIKTRSRRNVSEYRKQLQESGERSIIAD